MKTPTKYFVIVKVRDEGWKVLSQPTENLQVVTGMLEFAKTDRRWEEVQLAQITQN